MYSSVAWSTFTFLCNCNHHLFPELFSNCKAEILGLPRWSSGQESTYQCRGHRFNPCSGKSPHAAGQLSPGATATEPVPQNYWSPLTLEPVLCYKRSSCTSAREQPLLAATRESPRAATKTQAQPKINKWIIFKKFYWSIAVPICLHIVYGIKIE